MEYIFLLAASLHIGADTVGADTTVRLENTLTGGSQKTWIAKAETNPACKSDTLVFRLADHKYVHTDCRRSTAKLDSTWTLIERDEEFFLKMSGRTYLLDIYYEGDKKAMRLRIKGTSLAETATDFVYHSKD